MKRPLREVMNSYYRSLTTSEKKVADYVFNNMDKVIYYSITDLAEEAGVGETTVLRFCRKVGLKGYQDFKLTIAQNFSEANTTVSEDSEDSLVNSISKNLINTISSTASMLNEEDLEESIRLLMEAKRIHFFGIGTSGITALDAKSRLLRIGIQSDVIVDAHLQAMSAVTLGIDDVVIGISLSGSTRDTIEPIKIAKNNGATVIAITYHLRSPITQYADIVLLGGAKESPLEGGSLNVKVSQLFVIDLLCSGIALMNKERTLEMKQRTAKAVVNKII